MACCKCCCENGTPPGECCGSPSTCCKEPDVCCGPSGSKTCCEDPRVCCGVGSGQECCPEGDLCCGEECCPPSQECCGEGESQVCCNEGQHCCDGVCQDEPCGECTTDEECEYCADPKVLVECFGDKYCFDPDCVAAAGGDPCNFSGFPCGPFGGSGTEQGYCCDGKCEEEECDGCCYCIFSDPVYTIAPDEAPTIHGCAPTFRGTGGDGVSLYTYDCYLPNECGAGCGVTYPDFETLPEPPIGTAYTGHRCDSVCQVESCDP